MEDMNRPASGLSGGSGDTNCPSENGQPPVIALNGLCKSFGKTCVLDHLNLTVESGRIVGLLGPNGCGKTTLIKILTGMLPDFTGKVSVCGMEVGVTSKALVAYLPDIDSLPGNMTPKNAIAYFSDFFRDFDAARALELLTRFGLSPKQKIKTMSKGMQEKVQLILTMSRNARLYILDEPLGGVDPASREIILNLILDNYCQGSTVLISTHLLHDVERIFDQVIFLGAGRVLLQQDVEEMRTGGAGVEDKFKEVFGHVYQPFAQ